MAQNMTKDQWQKFLSEGTHTGKLATVRADGSPHIAPIWFLVDGDDIVLTTSQNSVKGRNMARDGRVCLCVDDERPPFSFVTVQGHAHLSDDMGELRKWATRIAARYMGGELAEEIGSRNAAPGELLVRIRIEKVAAMADVAE